MLATWGKYYRLSFSRTCDQHFIGPIWENTLRKTFQTNEEARYKISRSCHKNLDRWARILDQCQCFEKWREHSKSTKCRAKTRKKSPLSHLQCVSLNNSSAFLSRFLLAVMLAISLRCDVLQRNTNPTSFLYYWRRSNWLLCNCDVLEPRPHAVAELWTSFFPICNRLDSVVLN